MIIFAYDILIYLDLQEGKTFSLQLQLNALWMLLEM